MSEGRSTGGDDPVLPPAAPRRPSPPADRPAGGGPDALVLERLAVLERLVRGLGDRLVALDRRTVEGFQENASRALVIAEATDERLDHQAQAVAELRAALLTRAEAIERSAGGPAPTAVDLEPVMERLEAFGARVEELVSREPAPVPPDPGPALAQLQARVELVAERLGALADSPSRTDLQGGLDELERRLELVAEEVRAVRRRLPVRAPTSPPKT